MSRVATLLSRIPRVRLLDGPTPLERMPRIEAEIGHRGLWVKRDDWMRLGLGGNKLRSLVFWLGEATAAGADTLLVAGRAVSNQCRLTAAAAARTGFGCVVVHNDDPPARDEGNLLLSRLYGADLRFVGRMDEAARAREVEAVRAALLAEGRRPYVVGDPVTGALGYVAAALELHEQASTAGIDLRHVVLPGSMGVTEAGFLFGCTLLGSAWTAHLVTVEYPVEELARRIRTICEGLSARLGETPPDPQRLARHHDAWLGAGYEQPTPEARAAIRTFASREALLLEMTYTAKPFAALLDLVRGGVLPPDEPVCALHTGGVPALFGQAEVSGRA